MQIELTKKLMRIVMTASFVLMMMSGFTQSALAALKLELSDGVTTQIVTDSGTGAVFYSGNIGSFFIANFTAGFSDPILGTPSTPFMDISSVNVTGIGGPATLTIMLTDTDFHNTGELSFLASLALNSNAGTVQYNSFIDDSNTEFAQTTLLCGIGPLTGVTSGSCSGIGNLTDPYSLTEVLTWTLPVSSFGFLSVDASLRIPEPSAILLLGVGLVVLAAWGRWRIRRGSNQD